MKPKIRNRRKNKRIEKIKPTQILLKGCLLRVNDISSEGIGMILEKDGPNFFIGERLDAIPLSLHSGTVNLKGTVSHISVKAANTVLGIRFLFNEEEFNALVQFKKECALHKEK